MVPPVRRVRPCFRALKHFWPHSARTQRKPLNFMAQRWDIQRLSVAFPISTLANAAACRSVASDCCTIVFEAGGGSSQQLKGDSPGLPSALDAMHLIEHFVVQSSVSHRVAVLPSPLDLQSEPSDRHTTGGIISHYFSKKLATTASSRTGHKLVPCSVVYRSFRQNRQLCMMQGALGRQVSALHKQTGRTPAAGRVQSVPHAAAPQSHAVRRLTQQLRQASLSLIVCR